MSTLFNQYANGGYNSGYPNQNPNNYQPFLMPPINTAQMPMPGNSGTGGAGDPMNQYFGNINSSTTDGYNGGGYLGLNMPATGNSGESTSGSMSDTTLLARFQGIAKKLDTEVNPNEDKKIDTNDLQTALEDKSGKFSDQDKQVIQAMLDNQNGVRGKLDHLDGEDDGVIEINSINKMVVNPDAKQQTPEAKMNNTQALNTIADYMGTAIHLDKAGHRADKYVDKHGKLVAGQRGAWTTDRGKLQRMADDDQVPENVRTAAKKLLGNQKLLETIDTAHKGGNPDGKYSIKDFQDAIKKNPDIDKIGEEDTTTSSETDSYSSLPQPTSIPLAETPSSSSSSSHGE